MKLRILFFLAAVVGIGSVYTEAKADRGSTGTGTRDGGNIPAWQELMAVEIRWVDIVGLNAADRESPYCMRSLEPQGFSPRDVRSFRRNGFPTYRRTLVYRGETATTEVLLNSHGGRRLRNDMLDHSSLCSFEIIHSTLYLNGEETPAENLFRRLEHVFQLLVSQVRLDSPRTWVPPVEFILYAKKIAGDRRTFCNEESSRTICANNFLTRLMQEHGNETATRIRAAADRSIDGEGRCITTAYGAFRSLARQTLITPTNPLSPRFHNYANALIQELRSEYREEASEIIRRMVENALRDSYGRSPTDINHLQNEIAELSSRLRSTCEGTL